MLEGTKLREAEQLAQECTARKLQGLDVPQARLSVHTSNAGRDEDVGRATVTSGPCLSSLSLDPYPRRGGKYRKN